MPTPELPDLKSPMTPAPVAPTMRTFGDVGVMRDNIFNQALTSAQGLKPLQNDLYTLQLQDVGYSGPERFTRADQKKAVLSRGTLARRLQGTWTLTDNKTGQPVGQRRLVAQGQPLRRHERRRQGDEPDGDSHPAKRLHEEH